jgi:hypothetical protein
VSIKINVNVLALFAEHKSERHEEAQKAQKSFR